MLVCMYCILTGEDSNKLFLGSLSWTTLPCYETAQPTDETAQPNDK